MTETTLFPPQWRWRRLVACNLTAFGILGSWLWPPMRQFWELLDHAVFHALNAPLGSHPLWAHVWAVGSMRPTDMAAALAMLAVLIKTDWIFSAPQVRRAFFSFLSLLFLLTLFRVGLFSRVVTAMDWQHSSPSLSVEGAVRLSELFPDWENQWHMKDQSNQSFPGDHGAVLMLWAFFLWPFADRLRRLLIAVLLTLFMLPRLVAGAHWASDIFVGSLFLSLMTIGWGVHSPYLAKSGKFLECLGGPLLDRLGKLPGLRHLGLLACVPADSTAPKNRRTAN
ncbi:MAG: phosphoesterase [Betaproteobacteria bacterium HGW-Betaproteobacteria-11]|nr:MAG: phosphoesterase [Betaproteobacteria bacterium HGW-Betaproteobacteria-11]